MSSGFSSTAQNTQGSLCEADASPASNSDVCSADAARHVSASTICGNTSTKPNGSPLPRSSPGPSYTNLHHKIVGELEKETSGLSLDDRFAEYKQTSFDLPLYESRLDCEQEPCIELGPQDHSVSEKLRRARHRNFLRESYKHVAPIAKRCSIRLLPQFGVGRPAESCDRRPGSKPRGATRRRKPQSSSTEASKDHLLLSIGIAIVLLRMLYEEEHTERKNLERLVARLQQKL